MPDILGIIEFISKLRSEIRMDMTTTLDAIDLKILRLLQEDARLTTKELAGRVNLSTFDRSRLMGPKVSAEQPSIIDDPTMKSAFYGAPAVCDVSARRGFLYSIPDAFCCAENMVLEATELGLASCIIARAEATFQTPEGQALQKEWGVPDDYEARCFVLLGYCKGDYPAEKPRKPGRSLIVGE